MKGGGIFPGCLCLIVGIREGKRGAGRICTALSRYIGPAKNSAGRSVHCNGWLIEIPGMHDPNGFAIESYYLRPLQPPPGTDVTDTPKTVKEAA